MELNNEWMYGHTTVGPKIMPEKVNQRETTLFSDMS